jgi:hypothetical protein
MQLHEHFLCQILGQVPVVHHAQGEAVDHTLMSADQHAECGRLSSECTREQFLARRSIIFVHTVVLIRQCNSKDAKLADIRSAGFLVVQEEGHHPQGPGLHSGIDRPERPFPKRA